MRTLLESHGIAFEPIGPDIDLAREVAAIRQNSRHVAVGLVRSMKFGLKMVEQVHEDILALCSDVDLFVISAQSAAGKNEADQLDLPYLSVTLMPWSIPWDDPNRSLLQRIAYGMIDGLVGLITTQPLNRMRRRQGLPAVGKEGFTSQKLNLIPVSPVVFPPNPHWESRHQIVGYWYANPPEEWQPPVDLVAFLENGEPPLLISLGAMSLGEDDALDTANLFVNAVIDADLRAIIQGWEIGMKQMVLPPTIYHTGSVPHSWLLPHCAGLVHHGGYGTTAAGFRAGIPELVIPHIADQFYWGDKVYELGVGPKPIRRTDLDGERLTAALNDLTEHEQMRIASKNLGEKIEAEFGVENAVQLIEETFL
jgi:UDP:flavonoid glycosyltransferase YjiC (YdhE family)